MNHKNIKGWSALIALWSIFSWLCMHYLHMRYPGFFILLGLIASLGLIFVFKGIYKNRRERQR